MPPIEGRNGHASNCWKERVVRIVEGSSGLTVETVEQNDAAESLAEGQCLPSRWLGFI